MYSWFIYNYFVQRTCQLNLFYMFFGVFVCRIKTNSIILQHQNVAGGHDNFKLGLFDK